MSDSQLFTFNESDSVLGEDCQRLGVIQSSTGVSTDDLKLSHINELDYSNQRILNARISNVNQASNRQNPSIARKRIRKIRILFSDPSEIKAKIISQLQLLESNEFNENTKIKVKKKRVEC